MIKTNLIFVLVVVLLFLNLSCLGGVKVENFITSVNVVIPLFLWNRYSSSMISTFSPRRILLMLRTAHIFPHIEQVSSFSGLLSAR